MNIIGEVEKRFGQVNSTVFRQVNRVTDWWQPPDARGAAQPARAAGRPARLRTCYDTNAPPKAGPTSTSTSCPSTAPTTARSRTRPIPRWGASAPASAATPAERRPPRRRCRELHRPEPARGLRPAAQPRHLQAGRPAQRARRLLDPVREPRLVRPRRELPRRVHRGAAARRRRLARRQPDEGEGDQPGPHPHEQERAAADLRQHRHPLVGRLADLRLRRGAQPRAAHRRGRQDDGGGGMLPGRGPRRSSRAST